MTLARLPPLLLLTIGHQKAFEPRGYSYQLLTTWDSNMRLGLRERSAFLEWAAK
jgi:hypothetical protein